MCTCWVWEPARGGGGGREGGEAGTGCGAGWVWWVGVEAEGRTRTRVCTLPTAVGQPHATRLGSDAWSLTELSMRVPCAAGGVARSAPDSRLRHACWRRAGGAPLQVSRALHTGSCTTGAAPCGAGSARDLAYCDKYPCVFTRCSVHTSACSRESAGIAPGLSRTPARMASVFRPVGPLLCSVRLWRHPCGLEWCRTGSRAHAACCARALMRGWIRQCMWAASPPLPALPCVDDKVMNAHLTTSLQATCAATCAVLPSRCCLCHGYVPCDRERRIGASQVRTLRQVRGHSPTQRNAAQRSV